jgi:hypothetical protein
MRVAENHGVQGVRIERPGLTIPGLCFPGSLNQTAIKKDSTPSCRNDVAGSGYFTGRPEELQLHVANLPDQRTAADGDFSSSAKHRN